MNSISTKMPIETVSTTNVRAKWSDAELMELRNIYSVARFNSELNLTEFAERFNRLKSNVCRKARELGLTNIRRRDKEFRVSDPKYATKEERSVAIGAATKKWIAENGHPRGSLGMRHSEETKDRMAKSSRDMWNNPNSPLNSPAMAQRKSDAMLKNILSGKMRSGYSRSRGGRRADLDNRYFRSAWEANYARYLNWLKIKEEILDWEYEPKTFVFESIKRGTRAYTPDFLVTEKSGLKKWHEVKGWMDAKSKTRIDRFKRYFPNEILLIVGAEWFRQANKTIARIVSPYWESGTTR